MIHIRKATSKDIPTIVDMHIALQRHLEASNPHIWNMKPEYKEQIIAMYEKEPLILYIAKDGDTSVGYICGQIQVREVMTPRTIGYIRNIYIKPEYRKQGIGYSLVKTLVEYYSRENVDEVNLNYVVGNKGAESFWGKLGFRPIRVTANRSLKDLAATLQGSL